MKTKTISKKLSLNRATVTNLDQNEQSMVKAGGLPTACTLCLYTCTGNPCFGHNTDEFRTCTGCYGFTDSCDW